MFLPSVPQLLELASEMEKSRDHALVVQKHPEDGLWDDEELAKANREENASDQLALPGFAALESDAAFDRALFDGGEFGSHGRGGVRMRKLTFWASPAF